MIRAIIFDLDNTLLDFMSMKRKAITAAVDGMVEAGLEIESGEAYDKIMALYESGGWENQEIFNDFLKGATGEVDYKLLAAGIVAYRRARDAALTLYPGVQKTLITLAKMGLKLAIVSDAALAELGLSSEDVLMVGDWPERDMEGAHQIGIRTVFAKYGDTFGTVESGADWEVEDIFEIVSIVKSLNGA